MDINFWHPRKAHRMEVVDRLLALPALPASEQRTVIREVRWPIGAMRTLAQWQAKWGTA